MAFVTALLHVGRLGPAVTLLAGLALLAPLVPAQAGTAQAAARATAPAVRDGHLPTWAEVDALYEGFDDGSRETFPARETFVIKRNCISYDSGPTAPKGRAADYVGAFGNIPVHDGYEQPAVQTMSFGTATAAQKAYAAQKTWIDRCDGRTTDDGAGETKTFEKTGASTLGDKRVGYRLETVVEQTGDEPWHINQLVFWIRDGRFLVNVIVRQDVEDAVPSKPRLLDLARIALQRLP